MMNETEKIQLVLDLRDSIERLMVESSNHGLVMSILRMMITFSTIDRNDEDLIKLSAMIDELDDSINIVEVHLAKMKDFLDKLNIRMLHEQRTKYKS